MSEIVDLRDGYRIEVAPAVLPQGEFTATFHRRRYTPGGKTTWKRVGPHVLNPNPEQAAADLLTAINQGLVPDVEFKGGVPR